MGMVCKVSIESKIGIRKRSKVFGIIVMMLEAPAP
jgi:hypothetical protein